MYFSGPDYERNALTTFIRLFQMPLFIFISGYFQKPILNVSQAIEKIFKSIKHIGIPMLFWILIVYVAKLLLNSSQYNGVAYFVQQSHGVVGLFWYLGCLLLCLTLYTFISLCYNYNRIIGILLFSISIITSVLINISIFYFPFLWLFFCLGCTFKKVNLDRVSKYTNKVKVIFAIVLIVSVLGAYTIGGGYKTSWTFYNSDNSIFTLDSGWHSEIIFIIYRYCIYIACTFCAYYLLKKLYKSTSNLKITKIIVAIGKETLFLYVAHVSIISLFAKPMLRTFTQGEVLLPNYPFVRFYIVAALCTIIMAGLLYFIAKSIKKKFPSVSKLLIGN